MFGPYLGGKLRKSILRTELKLIFVLFSAELCFYQVQTNFAAKIYIISAEGNIREIVYCLFYRVIFSVVFLRVFVRTIFFFPFKEKNNKENIIFIVLLHRHSSIYFKFP